jgi:hypothetical protein
MGSKARAFCTDLGVFKEPKYDLGWLIGRRLENQSRPINTPRLKMCRSKRHRHRRYFLQPIAICTLDVNGGCKSLSSSGFTLYWFAVYREPKHDLRSQRFIFYKNERSAAAARTHTRKSRECEGAVGHRLVCSDAGISKQAPAARELLLPECPPAGLEARAVGGDRPPTA